MTAYLHNHFSEFCPGHVITASAQDAGGAVIGGAISGEGNHQFRELLQHLFFIYVTIEEAIFCLNNTLYPLTSIHMAIRTTTGLTARLLKRSSFPASHQWRRQFSAARPTFKEIQDAYILSASRTPTAKVAIILLCVLRLY